MENHGKPRYNSVNLGRLAKVNPVMDKVNLRKMRGIYA